MSKQRQESKPRERIARESLSLRDELLAKLREFVPQTFSNGSVDFEKLRELLDDNINDQSERFSFTWAGRRDAVATLQAPTSATLIPDVGNSVDFEDADHVFIEGENLETLKSLYRSYYGRVKMIYIDPPYNTGNDLIYPDNFSDPLENYLRITGQKNDGGNYLSTTRETSGRFHSAWLSMMYPRLAIARQLLRDDGVIFVTIDDHECPNLRLLMNEIFGEENFIGCIIWKKMDSPSRNDKTRYVSNYHDYVLCYARNRDRAGLKQKAKPEILNAYPFQLPDGRYARRRQLRKNGKHARREDRPTLWYPVTAPDGMEIYPIAPDGWEGRWVLSKNTWKKRQAEGMTEWIKRSYGWVPYYIEVAAENPGTPWPTIWTEVDQNRQAKAEFTELMGSDVEFDNPKPTSLVKEMLRMATSDADIVVDFFAGSGTTAQAVLDLNREDGSNRCFILVQIPEPIRSGKNSPYKTLADIARTRIEKSIGRLKGNLLDPDERGGPENLAFRAFKLANSNFRRWAGIETKDADVYAEQLELFADTLVPGWNPATVIWEVALREGFALTSKIDKCEVESQTVWRVIDPELEQSFYICLDDTLGMGTVRKLGLTRDDLFVCRDTALNDTLAANLALECRLKVL